MNRAISVGVNSLNSSKITDLSGDMLPPSPGALISGLALQPLAVPANEIDERPQLVLVIRASGKMLRLGPLDLRVTEISQVADLRFRQDVLHDRSEVRAQPQRQRHRESDLAPVENAARQETSKRLAHEDLLGSTRDFELVGNSGHELDEWMVQKRHPDLQRVLHADPIGQCQQVPRKVRVQV